jgi:hypothetical protein
VVSLVLGAISKSSEENAGFSLDILYLFESSEENSLILHLILGEC